MYAIFVLLCPVKYMNEYLREKSNNDNVIDSALSSFFNFFFPLNCLQDDLNRRILGEKLNYPSKTN